VFINVVANNKKKSSAPISRVLLLPRKRLSFI